MVYNAVAKTILLITLVTQDMVYTEYTKKRILHYRNLSLNAIVKALEDEGIRVSRAGGSKFLKRYEENGDIKRKEGSGRASVVNDEIKEIIEAAMQNDDETTATQLKVILRGLGHEISLRTIQRCRMQLGWTYRGSAYCQLIREGNKVKRLEWAQQYLTEGSAGFRDVIFTDETSVQLDPHRRFAYRKIGQPAKPKPR